VTAYASGDGPSLGRPAGWLSASSAIGEIAAALQLVVATIGAGLQDAGQMADRRIWSRYAP